MNAQIIERNGKPEWAVIPYGDYVKIEALLEDAEDIRDIEESINSNEVAIPGEVTFAIVDGIHPIRAWRDYQKMTIRKLAEKAGISAAYLSQIEGGKRNPTIETLKNIANALDIDVEILI